MRKLVPVVAAAISFAAVPYALAQSGTAAGETARGPTADASVVRVDRVETARRKVVHLRFQPWGRPSPRQVREIIRAEARRWRISPAGLARRVGCESRYRWWAGNGQYQGVLQFSYGTFHRGMRTIRDRRVKLVRSRVRRVNDTRVVHYSDGRVERKRGRPRHQRVTYVYTGRLPRRPSSIHAWAQLRIGAQAIRGISAVRNSEWSCGA
jgi:hypothetical protein